MNDLSSDTTFCSGIRCQRRGYCARWIQNLKRDLAAKGISHPVTINIAEFSNHDGTCQGNKFLPDSDIEPDAPETNAKGSSRRFGSEARGKPAKAEGEP